MTIEQRVAARYLGASGAGDAIPRIEQSLTAVTRFKDDLAGQVRLIDALIKAGEAKRLGRVTPIKASDVKFDGKRIVAVTQGTGGAYTTRITLAPQRGHLCTCPDWQRNSKAGGGPCKHVLALGLYWRDERLDAALNGLENRLDGILEHSEV